jgi:RNA polymerase sigma-70 factor (ECF subfamily)
MPDHWKTQNTLILRAKDPNDQDAWDEFVTHYQPFIEKCIQNIAHRQNHNEDLLQIVMIELWKSISRFDVDQERAKFRTWMSRVIRNTVIDYLKREKKAPMALEEIPERWNDETEIDRMIEKQWEIHISNLAIERVSKRFTGNAIQVFERSLEGESIENICSDLGITTASAYTLKNRVKKYVMLEIKQLQEYMEVK